MKSESTQTCYTASVHQYVKENVIKNFGDFEAIFSDFGSFLKMTVTQKIEVGINSNLLHSISTSICIRKCNKNFSWFRSHFLEKSLYYSTVIFSDFGSFLKMTVTQKIEVGINSNLLHSISTSICIRKCNKIFWWFGSHFLEKSLYYSTVIFSDFGSFLKMTVTQKIEVGINSNLLHSISTSICIRKCNTKFWWFRSHFLQKSLYYSMIFSDFGSFLKMTVTQKIEVRINSNLLHSISTSICIRKCNKIFWWFGSHFLEKSLYYSTVIFSDFGSFLKMTVTQKIEVGINSNLQHNISTSICIRKCNKIFWWFRSHFLEKSLYYSTGIFSDFVSFLKMTVTQKIEVGINSNLLHSISTSICIRKCNKNFWWFWSHFLEKSLYYSTVIFSDFGSFLKMTVTQKMEVGINSNLLHSISTSICIRKCNKIFWWFGSHFLEKSLYYSTVIFSDFGSFLKMTVTQKIEVGINSNLLHSISTSICKRKCNKKFWWFRSHFFRFWLIFKDDRNSKNWSRNQLKLATQHQYINMYKKM